METNTPNLSPERALVLIFRIDVERFSWFFTYEMPKSVTHQLLLAALGIHINIFMFVVNPVSH